MRKYTLTITQGENGTTMRAENQGFTVAELIAMLEIKKLDLVAQGNNDTNFKRYALHDDGTKTEIVEEK
jgi:arginine deiminase